jgi:hypothetical protein
MKREGLKLFLKQISKISDHHKKIEKLSGENFNVFKTLKLESSEVRMHSAFLAEFLNPHGTHGKGDLYLSLFTEYFEIFNFDTKSAEVEIEKYTGQIDEDYTQGGRIDILLTDKNNRRIIIENKIYAEDQKNQLVRYHNFDPKASLFYLTLFGSEPTDWSTGGKLDKTKYRILSYKTEVKKWMERCRKESATLPIIRETISQYINLIKYLTNQTTGDLMEEEIKQFIIENSEYVDSIDKCYQTLDSIIMETKEQFKKILNELHSEIDIQMKNGISIHAFCREDYDGVHFGYQAMKGGENISDSDEVESYRTLLKNFNNNIYSAKNWLGWYNPSPFERRQKFEHYDKTEIIKMYVDKEYLTTFITELIRQDQNIRKALQNLAQKEAL